jgi:4-amino-4-deoxy-L-arabinose transferase-like glycosyltransferase
MVKNLGVLLKNNLLIVLIILAATTLRVWSLNSQAIFFGDAGRDMLAAITAVEDKQLPMLGIPSSVPRFKQGPLTVWAHILLLMLPGQNIYYHSLFFALISVAAVVLVYEFATLYISKKTGLLAATFLAFSPLAVAHGRMTYHITPIPLAMIMFLFACVRLAEGKSRGLFFSILAWAFLFQFELATAPLILIPVFILFRRKNLLNFKNLLPTAAGLVIGLLPQIIYDLTHNFEHLGGFAIWVFYRLGSTATAGKHAFSIDKFSNVAAAFSKYFGRMISTDQEILVVLLFAGLALAGYFLAKQAWHQKLPMVIELLSLSFGLLVLSFFIHGGPSEAYFPPFLILIPLLLGYTLTQLPPKMFRVMTLSILGWSIYITWSIFNHNFFVSNLQKFSYGHSVGEQRKIVTLISTVTNGDFHFKTTGQTFPSFFDNLRVVAWEQGLKENQEQGKIIYIETKSSPLNTYPDIIKTEFPTVDLYQLL